MRRLLLVLLMVLLPLQSGWAVAASVCAHETRPTAHFGHHAHDHQDAVRPASAAADADPAAGSGIDHADCQVCHGLGAVCAQSRVGGVAPWSAAPPIPAAAHVLPEPPLDPLLRPPLVLVA